MNLTEDIMKRLDQLADSFLESRQDEARRLIDSLYEIKITSLIKSKVKLIFLSCGSKERPENIQKATAALKSAGFTAVSYISPDTGHEFQTWRRSLYELAPLLFRGT